MQKICYFHHRKPHCCDLHRQVKMPTNREDTENTAIFTAGEDAENMVRSGFEPP
jgi:hypothetical protein